MLFLATKIDSTNIIQTKTFTYRYRYKKQG